MTTLALRHHADSELLRRLVESPHLEATVRGMSARTFAATLRQIGVADAGTLVALASTEQLVSAFDEDLFTNERPGERETFDRERFVEWLEVLLEAGEERVAARFAELSEDFVLHALASLVVVLDDDALRDRMQESDDDLALAVDKSLESCLSQEIDGYLLVSRDGSGWDAVLRLVLALDREHRPLLERLLSRAARLSDALLDDLDALATTLTAAESLAEDVEAEREDRRAAQGFVEPRAARAFLELAREAPRAAERDPITRAYFRDLAAQPAETTPAATAGGPATVGPPLLTEAESTRGRRRSVTPSSLEALRRVRARSQEAFDARLEEIVFLANVLAAAGAADGPTRLLAAEAAQAALATVVLGATLVATSDDVAALAEVLLREPADVSFRRAASALHHAGRTPALVHELSEVTAAIRSLRPRRTALARDVRKGGT